MSNATCLTVCQRRFRSLCIIVGVKIESVNDYCQQLAKSIIIMLLTIFSLKVGLIWLISQIKPTLRENIVSRWCSFCHFHNKGNAYHNTKSDNTTKELCSIFWQQKA